jgi:hypothetical protein
LWYVDKITPEEQYDTLAEWLRRLIRNQLGSPA